MTDWLQRRAHKARDLPLKTRPSIRSPCRDDAMPDSEVPGERTAETRRTNRHSDCRFARDECSIARAPTKREGEHVTVRIAAGESNMFRLGSMSECSTHLYIELVEPSVARPWPRHCASMPSMGGRKTRWYVKELTDDTELHRALLGCSTNVCSNVVGTCLLDRTCHRDAKGASAIRCAPSG